MINKILVGDFETTVYENQSDTEVWASALAFLNSDKLKIFNSIDKTYDYLLKFKGHVVIYYHNLKFDGSFWLDFLMRKKGYKNAWNDFNEEFESNRNMKVKTVKYLISDMGQWYTLTFKPNSNLIIELRDSVKLLPMSVAQLAKSFDTSVKKLEIEYSGKRKAGENITDEEKEYIKNDVIIVKEVLEYMFNNEHNKLTIGSCCMNEFKNMTSRQEFDQIFPRLDTIYSIDPSLNADQYCRFAYRGGWCYLNEGKEKKLITNGQTYDVNSLYPSVMESDSGSLYPYGYPTFWKGNYIPDEALSPFHVFIIRIKTKFKLKKNYVPTIQIKNDYRYRSNEWLKTSDVYYNGKYYESLKLEDGSEIDSICMLTLTSVDYDLFLKHYDIDFLEIIDGCYFWSSSNFFGDYISKYKKMKKESTGAKRQLAKLFLVNLYGKFGTSTNSSFKMAELVEGEPIKFNSVFESNKKPGYVPVACFVTAYARKFTIEAAQENYENLIYSDTDSLHLEECDPKGITIHDTNFRAWKLENKWDVGYFLRQKSYIERTGNSYLIKMAGLPERSKILIEKNLLKDYDNLEEFSEIEKNFIKNPITLTDIDVGLKVPGSLKAKRIVGGVVLKNQEYEIR